MSRHSAGQQSEGFLVTTILWGFCISIGVALVLSVFGSNFAMAIIFAILSGVWVAAFVYRERSLTANLNSRGEACQIELRELSERLDTLYIDSLACLVYFDAGTLSVDRMSPGLMKGLQIAPDAAIRGKSLAEILRVSQSKLEAVVSQSKEKGHSDQPFELTVQDASGFPIPTIITTNYLPQAHMVEASIFFARTSEREELEEVERAKKDLDRFCRGLYRRESRILELKEEINNLLRESGKLARYRVDRSSDHTNSAFPGMKSNEETGGRNE
jgi:hypothetical protein